MPKVVILCGGLGTRLREETVLRPKPMLEIGGRPILWHIMKTYAHYGYKDFVLCLGYLGNDIRNYFLNYKAMNNDVTVSLETGARLFHGKPVEQDFSVTLVDTGPNTMTGGRLKHIEPYIDDDLFLATYGDGLADVDIDALLAFHKAHGKMATITATRPIGRFGVLDVDDKSVVKHFVEKPHDEGWINAGYFVFNRKFFDYLKPGNCVLEHEPLSQAALDGELVAYKHKGSFFVMDTYREYAMLNKIWDEGNAPWKVWD